MQGEKMSPRKRLIGEVISDKPEKTVVVQVSRKAMHPTYKKYITKRHRYHVHDEENRCKVGDRVEIEETRPLSKLKHFRVIRVVGEER
ncbi:30S ribosomal protein S17 [candidate division TA06 bacterium B3_TA06]|uniref:Small ribosomal subunit protein uS17 n=1 Tax=candidate division TA06 bacterium B3_TA06 TaxID=2012487 RepID=A0A532V446_UNCT6|nr:MAG: 30S ribosomal protein S17 [candidate division TA06 bacterium B3_TA06]